MLKETGALFLLSKCPTLSLRIIFIWKNFCSQFLKWFVVRRFELKGKNENLLDSILRILVAKKKSHLNIVRSHYPLLSSRHRIFFYYELNCDRAVYIFFHLYGLGHWCVIRNGIRSEPLMPPTPLQASCELFSSNSMIFCYFALFFIYIYALCYLYLGEDHWNGKKWGFVERQKEKLKPVKWKE